jgi:hypothetical protein
VKIKWSGKRTLVAAALLIGVLWLYAMGSEQRRGEGEDGSDTSTNTAQCRIESTVDGLNIRSAPALNPGNVVGELNQGEVSNAAKVVQNGFRKLAEGRWVSEEFAKPVEGTNC